MQFDEVVAALQRQLGRDVPSVGLSLIVNKDSPAVDASLVVLVPGKESFQVRLRQDDGDVLLLVQRSSRAMIQHVAPFRAAALGFLEGMKGDTKQVDAARDIILSALQQPPTQIHRTERTLMHNLLGVIRVMRGDLITADMQFTRAEQLAIVPGSTGGVIAFNRALLAVAAKNTAAAQRYLQLGESLNRDVALPFRMVISNMVIKSLVIWSTGDTDQAEALLREAVKQDPENELAHRYLSQLLSQKGDPVGSDYHKHAADLCLILHEEVPGLLVWSMWFDPVKGGMTRRAE